MKLYSHFTYSERICLQEKISEGKSIRYIAKLLNKHPSSVSREIRRNTEKGERYNYKKAESLARTRRRKSVRKRRLLHDKKLKIFVLDGLKKFWSPEIISACWKQKEQGNKLSPSTIYKALKDKILDGYTPQTHLRRRGKKKYEKRSKYNAIQPEHLISDWSDEIKNRTELWHFEGDTLCGGKGKGGLTTLVDRKSRYLVCGLLNTLASEETKRVLLKSLKGVSVRSISLDNGSEFALHKSLAKKLGIKIYFANPRAPWERGSNENINGLLRFFFPKGHNFHKVTQRELNYVVSLINNRPRKCLNWLSPIQYLQKCCT